MFPCTRGSPKSLSVLARGTEGRDLVWRVTSRNVDPYPTPTLGSETYDRGDSPNPRVLTNTETQESTFKPTHHTPPLVHRTRVGERTVHENFPRTHELNSPTTSAEYTPPRIPGRWSTPAGTRDRNPRGRRSRGGHLVVKPLLVQGKRSETRNSEMERGRELI